MSELDAAESMDSEYFAGTLPAKADIGQAADTNRRRMEDAERMREDAELRAHGLRGMLDTARAERDKARQEGEAKDAEIARLQGLLVDRQAYTDGVESACRYAQKIQGVAEFKLQGVKEEHQKTTAVLMFERAALASMTEERNSATKAYMEATARADSLELRRRSLLVKSLRLEADLLDAMRTLADLEGEGTLAANLIRAARR